MIELTDDGSVDQQALLQALIPNQTKRGRPRISDSKFIESRLKQIRSMENQLQHLNRKSTEYVKVYNKLA